MLLHAFSLIAGSSERVYRAGATARVPCTPARVPWRRPTPASDVAAVPYAPAVTSPPWPTLYGLDIETDTSRGGLDPSRAAIVAAAVAGPGHTTVLTGAEASLLVRLETHLGALPPGVLVTWYGSRFDLPFVAERARRCGIDLRLDLSPCTHRRCFDERPYGPERCFDARWGAHRHIDACLAWRQLPDQSRLRCGLKEVARRHGLAPVVVERASIHRLTRSELRLYVARDATLARLLALSRWESLASSVDGGRLRAQLPAGRPAGGRAPLHGAALAPPPG